MNALRVGVDVTALLGPPTGIHRVTRALVDQLGDHDAIDLRGWLLTARGGRPDVSFPVRRSRVPAALVHRLWARGRALGRAVTGPVDVAHGPNFLAPPGPTSVVSLQDLTPVTHPEWCRPEVAAMAPAIRNAVAEGTVLHVSSAAVGDEAVRELGAVPDQIRLVHHAVEPLAAADPATAVGIAGAETYVLLLGTVEHRKNPQAAVRALAELPDHVRLVVSGPAGNAESTLDSVRGLVDPARIRRLPTVDDNTRAALVRGATALLWPSIYEGFALPPLEALGVGTPVVATAVGALPELVGDRVDLVAPGDDDAFVAATVAAVENPTTVDPALMARIGDLTWARAAEEMVAVYRETASR